MAIDEERYEEYRQALNDQLSGLSSTQRMRALQSRLLDHLAKNEIPPGEADRVRPLVRRLFDEEMAGHVDDIVQRYEQTREVVNTLYDDIGTDLRRDMPRVQAIEQAGRGDFGNYKESTITEITNRTSRGLLQGEGVDELRSRIAPVSQKAARYADTIAKTQVKAYGRAAKQEKARIGGVEHLEYVGLIRSTTRPFCRAMVGTTHHIDQIQKMRNGNREPVETYCGGWNCIHDWEPDPFADSSTDATFQTRQDQGSDIRFRTDDQGLNRFRKGQNHRHFRQLDDPEAYRDRARQAPASDEMLQKKVDKHDLGSVENARELTQYVRKEPDQTYYQFHDSRSTVVFERDQYFVFATENEVKTIFRPESDGYEAYKQHQVSTFIEMD